jgi:hypothetical protein
MQENTMYFDDVKYVTVMDLKRKRVGWNHFHSCIKFVFKIDGFLGLRQDVVGKRFAAIMEQIVLTPRVHKRDLILSGKADSFPSTKRKVVQQQPENSG